MKIDWRQKLSSRKFWAAVISVVVSVCVIFGVDGLTVEQVVGLVTAVGALVAYILGEGFVDAARIKSGGKDSDDESLV